jgi:hypothetical protein
MKAVALVALVLWAAPGYAQVTAAISGTIEDQAGGLVSDAVVTVKSLVLPGLTRPGRSESLRCRWGRRKSARKSRGSNARCVPASI